MRLDFFLAGRQLAASSAAALAAAALLGLAAPARAQSFDAGGQVAAAAANVLADVIPATPDALAAPRAIPATLVLNAPAADGTAADSGPLAAAPASTDNAADETTAADTNTNAADTAAADPSQNDDDSVVAGLGALDDQTLSRQRGGAVGMLMVAATPQLMHGGNHVTLWDEIAPPAPLPIPVDSSQAAQGNVASYTRR